MKVTPQITFHHAQSSEAVEARIREELEDLETVYDRITSCRVTVEAPPSREYHGQTFHVKIFLAVPGSEIVVDHVPGLHSSLKHSGAEEVEKKDEAGQEHRDVYLAITDAFEAARRQLEKYAESQRDAGRDRDNLSAAGTRER
ncbi:MAG TPA: HPF/RaiA family ribosome-associated protein [Verrucomicrobiales bacterium]|jgi:ribosome-associated translation inhibitor RaiA|nr:HPF/RaiA family ribosome-associated protein [Verrucomicrobiales bacterium]